MTNLRYNSQNKWNIRLDVTEDKNIWTTLNQDLQSIQNKKNMVDWVKDKIADEIFKDVVGD